MSKPGARPAAKAGMKTAAGREKPVSEKVVPAAQGRRQWVVVAYDIPDDRHRNKIMKALGGYGQWAQYSVFECDLRPGDLERMVARLRLLMRKELDDIRVYPLCETCLQKAIMLGKAQVHRHKPFEIV